MIYIFFGVVVIKIYVETVKCDNFIIYFVLWLTGRQIVKKGRRKISPPEVV